MEGCRHRLARLASGRRTRAQSLSPRPRALSARRQEEIALEINACTASSGFQLLLVRSCDDEKPSEHHKDKGKEPGGEREVMRCGDVLSLYHCEAGAASPEAPRASAAPGARLRGTVAWPLPPPG